MGIKNLNSYFRNECSSYSINQKHLSVYRNKKFVIDTLNLCALRPERTSRADKAPELETFYTKNNLLREDIQTVINP